MIGKIEKMREPVQTFKAFLIFINTDMNDMKPVHPLRAFVLLLPILSAVEKVKLSQ